MYSRIVNEEMKLALIVALSALAHIRVHTQIMCTCTEYPVNFTLCFLDESNSALDQL
jgi:hypothetical protein